MEDVALIVGIVSIGLAIVAIWLAIHHKDQSDKLNRDTTEKLARIEAFATSTKEDAFKELERWGDFARAGGKAMEEAEKAKEEEIKKLKEEIETTTSAQINKVLQTVEGKLNSSTQTSTISEIKKEFEELKKGIGEIQDNAVVETARSTEEYNSILTFLNILERKEKYVMHSIAQKDNVSYSELLKFGHDRSTIDSAIAKAKFFGLIRSSQPYLVNERGTLFSIPDSLKRALLT